MSLAVGVSTAGAAIIGVTACKNRANAEESTLRSEAAPPAAASCEPVVAADGKAVSSTSLSALIARAKNPACKARFLQLPLVRQTKGFTCGAASLKSILFYFGDFIAETELQRILRSHKENGTSFKRIIRLVSALNDKASREKIAGMYGFDSKVDLSELELVLNDPAVLAAIKAKAGSNATFASVVKGIEALRTDALDIDSMGSLSTGLGLTEGAEPVDSGHRVQPRLPVEAEPHQNTYSTKLFFEPRPYDPSGPRPEGCPAEAPPAVAGSVGKTRAMTLGDLTQAIDEGSPVLALTQAWSFTNDKDYDLAEYSKSWYSGHYVVVIGYDEKNIYYMDPYDMGHYAFLPKAEWERRWHDYDGLLAADGTTRCPGGTELEHFGLVISRSGGPAYRPDLITKMY